MNFFFFILPPPRHFGYYDVLRSSIASPDNHHGVLESELSVVKYLHTWFGLSVADARANDNVALRWASKNGHLPVVQYLHEELGLTD